jgi:hypothetical protein
LAYLSFFVKVGNALENWAILYRPATVFFAWPEQVKATAHLRVMNTDAKAAWAPYAA